jgi:hypothetical protein
MLPILLAMGGPSGSVPFRIGGRLAGHRRQTVGRSDCRRGLLCPLPYRQQLCPRLMGKSGALKHPADTAKRVKTG